MRFIFDNTELSDIFFDLCSDYSHYKWAVAWAGDPDFLLGEYLSDNEDNIERIVVGLHFYQTSPNFIRRYSNNSSVRFYWQTDGTFHSKIYLFYNSRHDWAAIVGSSNFTKAGFSDNKEANILISNKDVGSETFDQISEYIDQIWEEGKMFSKADLERYEEAARQQKNKLDSLSNFQATAKEVKASSFSSIGWEEFYNRIVNEDERDELQDRIDILDTAQNLFKKYKHFKDMPINTQKCIAGIAEKLDEVPNMNADWKLFGSMLGAGRFKQAIIQGNEIGKALDAIPLEGEVSRSQFEKYCEAFSAWFDPLATATRLLAIKRPDRFVCIDARNKEELAKFFKIPKSRLTLRNYWDEVLDRIYQSDWFNEQPIHPSKQEASVWKYRAAMIDGFCYRPLEK